MSPECTGRTNRPIDQRRDIYSLGMLVHAVLGSSQDTNANRTTSEIIYECLTVTLPPLSFIVEGQDSELTASLQRALDRMTAKLPEDRIASCAEVIRKLDADQLRSFSDASLFVLLSGALLGHSFSLDDLSQLLKMSPSSVHHLLQPIVHRGYLRIQGGHMWDEGQDAFDDGDLHSPVTGEWEHDQHQQAAVCLLRERSDYEHAYSAVGCSLLERLLEGERERVFDVVQLLRQAPSVTATTQDQVNMIKLIIVACSEARTTSAFETGFQYAHQAMDMVTDAVWDADYDIAFRAYHSLLASQHDTKRLGNMQATLDILSKRSLLPFDQALVMEMQIIQLISEGCPGEALEDELFQTISYAAN
ncbi:hypothetical protein RI367_000508 [Sorochytrium milnesiophthora]